VDPTASIEGQVVSTSAADGPARDVTVRVQGTDVATVTGSQGRFALPGVPMGDQTLAFERAGQTATLPVGGILAGERIALVVLLDGSSVQVQSLERGGTGGEEAEVSLEKATNGEDADRPPGPAIPIGDPVEWTYVVTNTGAAALSRIDVTDDQGVVVTCPRDTLAPGESMTCTGSGVAGEGQYANVGTASAFDPDGNGVDASDPSHYLGTGASIDLEKATNGEDADVAPGPTIPTGAPVAWDYTIVNDGAVELFDITVIDDQRVLVTCPGTSLRPGAGMTCTGDGIAAAGQYANLGTVTAQDANGFPVSDSDPSHYFGDGEDGELTAAAQPDHWNTNWPGSSGTVSVKIEGGDLASIDPSSILLFETDPLVAALPSSAPGITGNHIRARFSKADAFSVLDAPQTGETRIVTIQFVAAGVLVEIQDEIQIVGPPI
jgi:hypothetical protein